MKVGDVTSRKKWVKFWEFFGIFWKKFFESRENFFENFDENSTTVYKAGLSKVRDLYNLVTKYVTKYPVLATLKITKKTLFFSKNWRCFFL